MSTKEINQPPPHKHRLKYTAKLPNTYDFFPQTQNQTQHFITCIKQLLTNLPTKPTPDLEM